MQLGTENLKKQLETNYLEEARRVCSIFPAGRLIPHERPDFLLPLDNRTIGIEVTELCKSGERAEAGRLSKVVDKAKDRYARLAVSEPLDVIVTFSEEVGSLSFEALTNSLAEFVHSQQRRKVSGKGEELPDGFSSISIHTPLAGPTGRWQGIRAFCGELTTPDFLVSRIAEKNKRVPEYRQSAPECWLLIVNDHFLGPGEVYLRSEDLMEWRFSSDFDKVLFFAREAGGGGKVFELQGT